MERDVLLQGYGYVNSNFLMICVTQIEKTDNWVFQVKTNWIWHLLIIIILFENLMILI